MHPDGYQISYTLEIPSMENNIKMIKIIPTKNCFEYETWIDNLFLPRDKIITHY